VTSIDSRTVETREVGSDAAVAQTHYKLALISIKNVSHENKKMDQGFP
jgi:hypothetical protein